MHKLLGIVLALSMTVGCEDSAVSDKVTEILQKGSVHAEVVCEQVLCGGSQAFVFKADLLQDGASIVSYALSGPFTSFNKRGDDVKVCEINGPQRCFEASDGFLSITRGDPGQGGCNESFALDDTGCSGFNLEAFGVE